MASWQDGPQYAPVERPDGFAQPTAKPLASPVHARNIVEDAPKSAPTVFAPPKDPVPELATLSAASVETRDPKQPFPVTSPPPEKYWQPTEPIITTNSVPVSSTSTGSAWGTVAGMGWRSADPAADLFSSPVTRSSANPNQQRELPRKDFLGDLLDYTNWLLVLFLGLASLVVIPSYGRYGWAAIMFLTLATTCAYQSKVGEKFAQTLCVIALLVTVTGGYIAALLSGLTLYGFWVLVPIWATNCSRAALIIYLGYMIWFAATNKINYPQ